MLLRRLRQRLLLRLKLSRIIDNIVVCYSCGMTHQYVRSRSQNSLNMVSGIDTPRPEGTGILSSATHLAITGLHQQ